MHRIRLPLRAMADAKNTFFSKQTCFVGGPWAVGPPEIPDNGFLVEPPHLSNESSQGRPFSISAMKERCAQGQVEVPLNVWLLFQNVMGGPW